VLPGFRPEIERISGFLRRDLIQRIRDCSEKRSIMPPFSARNYPKHGVIANILKDADTLFSLWHFILDRINRINKMICFLFF